MRPVPSRAALLAALAGGLLGLGLLRPPALALEPLTLGLLGAWTLWRLGWAWAAWRTERRWHRSVPWQLPSAALPQVETGRWVPWARHVDPGLFLGRAFRWSAHHTQGLEGALAREGALPVAEDARGGHPALHAVGQRHERPLVLPWSELVGHVLVAGTTRSGKTRCLELLAAEAIRAPGAVIILDPKGDTELLARCAWEAQQHGRPFALFSAAFPRQSATFNPLETAATPTEVATRIQALMPGGGEKRGDPFFTEYPLAVIERVAAAQATLGQRWTLEGLEAPAVLRPQMEALLTAYLRHLLGPARGDGDLPRLIAAYQRHGPPDAVANALIDDLQKPRDHFQKVTANLIPAFRGVTGAPLGPLLSTLPADLTWDRIVDRQMVVYFALAALLLGEVANRIGRVLLQDLTGFLGRRYAYDDVRTATPITILVDEFSNVAYPLFIDALNKAGGANARFCLAMQSLADPEAAMGRERAQQVFDNLNTKLWFRLADPRTAEEATRGLGTGTVLAPEEGAGLSYGGVGGLSGRVDRRLTRQEVPLLRPEWLMALPRGEAVVRLRGEVWKLRVPLLTPPPSTVLARLGLTDNNAVPLPFMGAIGMRAHSLWHLLAVGLALGLWAAPGHTTPPTWWVQPAVETCETLGVPGVLAVAVILTESRGQPYAIRVNQGKGTAVFPATYDAGVQAVTAALARTRNLDLGLMQVNYATWGPRLGLTPVQLLQPAVNLLAGCTVLRQTLATRGALWQQLGRYHSPTPARQARYARQVAAWLAVLAK